MNRKLTLRRYAVQYLNVPWAGAYRMRVVAVDPDPPSLDPNVFLMHRGPISPYTGDFLDTFQCVASPVDLSDYPVGAPDPKSAQPFFRTNQIEVDLRSTKLADYMWTSLKENLCVLLQALDRLDDLTLMEEFTCGEPGSISDIISVPG